MKTSTALLICAIIGAIVAVTLSPAAGIAFVAGAGSRAAWKELR